MFNRDKIRQLQQKNKELQVQLDRCREWMRREVQARSGELSTVGSSDDITKISERVDAYLGDQVLIGIPAHTLSYLVDAEINFTHLGKHKSLDGFIVTAAYQKILEQLLDKMVLE